jgi:hypothetical protein
MRTKAYYRIAEEMREGEIMKGRGKRPLEDTVLNS